MAEVLILGGGFGGLAAAHELRRLLPEADQITLVDRRDRFAMGFAKLWDLAAVRPLADGTRSLHDLASHGVRFVQADIEGIDPAERSVQTAAGALRGDALLVALGAADHPSHLAMLGGKAHNLYDPAALPAMRADLADVREGRVVIAVMGALIKCPPAPFEAAFLVDALLRTRGVRDDTELTVATPQPATLPVAGPEASRVVADALAERDIELLTEHTVADIVTTEPQEVRFDAGTARDYAVLLAVPQNVPPAVVAASPLASDSGWIRPDRASLRTDFERVYAVGDCTTVPVAYRALPKAGVFAEGEALVAARNIASDLHGGEYATYDGHGFCFLEFPGHKVAYVEGDFYAEPDPDVRMSPPDEAAFRAKQEFERERLARWLS